MKVLHLSSEKTWRGGEQQIAYLIGELKKHGVDSVVALRKGSSFEDFCKKNQIPYVAYGFSNEFDLLTAYQVKQYAQSQKVDVVHLHTAKGHGIGVLAAVLGMKTPLVLSKRTDFPIRNNAFAKFKFNHPSIKKILCVSSKIKEIIDPDLKNPNKSLAVHSGVDLKKFKFEKKFFFHDLLGLSHDIKLVGNTSAIAPHKDYNTFVKTAAVVCKKNPLVRFLIIGSGPLENEIRALVKSENLEDKVLFTGFLNNLPEVLFNLDVFLITSNEEGLGTSILDAHACHIPVVGTRAGGIPEIVINGISGTLCEVGDVEALAKAVEARLADHELFQAYELVKKFSKEATGEKTVGVYRGIINLKS